ncbi:MAG: polyphenol oxidase family protein [Fretibacterium sp.]|nr:polyphenol oxidase family protein [Fretibacterium sp.]
MKNWFENRETNPDHFRLEREAGQNILRFLPEPSFADARFLMRGPLMDGSNGDIAVLQERLARVAGFPAARVTGFPADPMGVSLPLIAPRQVHGVEVIESAVGHALPSRPEADGILLTSGDVEASLRFADCAPVLILPSEEWARRNRPWALLLHSGYRGTVQNIARAGLQRVAQVMGQGAVASASAWVGPCIAGESYPRTWEAWTERGLAAFHPENVRRPLEDPPAGAEGRFYFDLAGELRAQLRECGLAPRNIFVSGLDTASAAGCYSYRRGDKVDRMMLLVRLAGRQGATKRKDEGIINAGSAVRG